MRYFLILLIFTTKILAKEGIEVIRPVYKNILELKIVRAEVDSFETYLLKNYNGREMNLVCANNLVYKNRQAFIIYRNFYGETVNRFVIEDNRVCYDMAKFIESSSFGVDEDRPFLISLSKSDLKVRKITYPKIDPYADSGIELDLLPKKDIPVRFKKKKTDLKVPGKRLF